MIRCMYALALGLLVSVPSFGQSDKAFAPDEERLARAKSVEAEALAKNDSMLLAEAYYLYGKVYTNGGDLAGGEAYFLKSLRILEPRGDSYEVGRLYIRLSDSDVRLRRHDSALETALRAEKIFARAGAEKGLQLAYGTLGNLYRLKKDYPRASDYLRKAEAVAVALNDSLGIADASHRLGLLLASQKSEETFVYFEKAKTIFRALGHTSNLASTCFRMVEAYLSFDRLTEARRELEEAEKLYSQLSSPQSDLLVGVQEAFRKYFEKTGNWRDAYEYEKRRSETEYRRLGVQRDSIIRRLHIEFESEKKDGVLAAQENLIRLTQENLRLQRSGNVILAAALLLAAGLILIFYRLYQKNQKLSKHNAHLVREQGHRIRNHLQMISNMLQLNSGVLSDPEAKAMLVESELRVQSIAMLQKGLYSGDSGAEVFLPEYFALLTDHVLEVSGYGWVEKRLDIEAIFLDPDRALPVALILNELVTNACKYGFPGHPSPRLALKCRQEEGRIHFSVADNGPGFEPSLPGSEQSFGMQLIRIQAEQLYAVYSFQNDPETGGARFEMEFSV